jgi:hypothetical protein
MAGMKLKRYGLEGGAKILIVIGLLFNLLAWIAAAYYFGLSSGKIALFIVPLIFTCISAVLLVVIRYRYTLFEKYPYLMNLPSIFYRIGQGKDGVSKQSMAFSMIFTVHTLVLAALGFMGILLTVSIGYSEQSNAVSPFLYSYLVVVVVLILAVFLQYRRIYIKFSK